MHAHQPIATWIHLRPTRPPDASRIHTPAVAREPRTAPTLTPMGAERHLRIERRFRGPARSGNGGYTAGLLGAALEPGTAQVTLRRPPPLETDLVLTSGDGSATLTGPDGVVADATELGALTEARIEPVSVDEARAVESSYKGLVNHPFPSCFACGPDNTGGLRLRPGLVGPGRTACTWTPAADLTPAADPGDDTAELGDGAVATPYVWAALDCPGGWTADLEGRPMVLGRLAVAIDNLPRTGQTYVVVGQHLGDEGRKTFTAAGLYDAQGRLLASARHTWIAVDPAAFE